MRLSYKYRLYPNKECKNRLLLTLHSCRFLYNKLLEISTEAKDKGEKLKPIDTQAMLPDMKKDHPFLKSVHAKPLQMVNYQLWSNIKALNGAKKKGCKIGKLRFKGMNRYKSINYNQSGFHIDTDKNILRLSKIGDVRIKLHRPVGGDVKAVVIKYDWVLDKWWAIVQIEKDPVILPKTGNDIGVDVGIDFYAVDTDGFEVENPKHIDKSQERIKTLQKRLSRKVKGSNNRDKAKYDLAKAHEKVRNQRMDYLHKLSRYYVNNNDVINIEGLNIKGMLEDGNKYKHTLHRHIADAGWAMFGHMVSYKAEGAGRIANIAEPKGTTQRCANCGRDVPKKLWHRIHKCPYCGFTVPRDYNSALEIRNVGTGQAEVTPAEMEPLLREISYMDIVTGQALSRKQEAPSSALGEA